MEIDLHDKTGEEVYSVMVGLVAPRPIAWVTSLSAKGVLNLAPFSFFNLFGVSPPIVAFSPTLKRDGSKKDTLLNIEANKEFVIHAATELHVDQINLSSKPLPHDHSELELVNLATVPSAKIGVPRLADAPFALECRLQQIISLGGGPLSGNLIIGEIVYMHICESVLDAKGIPDPRKLKSIARLGAEYWCKTSDLFEKTRPT